MTHLPSFCTKSFCFIHDLEKLGPKVIELQKKVKNYKFRVKSYKNLIKFSLSL